jgi:acetylornithine deacetylase/succinyl-diaminopimelate desuccinylase-like protein
VARTTEQLLGELVEYLRIPSISSGDGHPDDLRRAAEWVRDRIVAAGGTAEVLPTAANPLVVGELAATRADAPRVLLYGHYDVQTVAPLDAWTTPPFEPTIRDGALYARGASDDKGNAHALLAAAADLAADGELPVRLTIVLDGEEEIGGHSVIDWIDARPQGAFDAAIVFDAGFVEPGRPALEVGVRGVITATVTVRTGERDAHSGLYGGAALNAAHVLSRLIADLEPGPDGRLHPSLMEGVEPPSAAELATWGDLPDAAAELAIAGIAPKGPEALADYHLRTTALPTFDVNAITCRDAGANRTIVPCEATAAISFRLVGGQDAARFWAAVQALLRERAPAGAELAFELRGSAEGAAFDPELPALRLARAAIERATGMPCAVTRSGGAIPLVTALARKGVPTALSGCALPGDRIHAPDEHLRLDQYALGVRMAREILLAFGDLPAAAGR